MNLLSQLPNRVGFKFIGITRGIRYIKCHISMTPEGTYVILDESSNRVYSDLIGWNK